LEYSCIPDWDYRSSRTGRVALPFCSIHLTAPKLTKPLPILNTVGDHIRRRRLELKLLQSEVAKQLGVKTDTILNWEHNRTAPTLRHIPKVIAFLGCNPTIEDPKTLGEKVLQYRKSHGLSQKQLAKRIRIDPTTLSRLERNKRMCFREVLQKAKDFLREHS